jgi:hypothetical protein
MHFEYQSSQCLKFFKPNPTYFARKFTFCQAQTELIGLSAHCESPQSEFTFVNLVCDQQTIRFSILAYSVGIHV